jgi:very-short-patch-repair endonuclease
MSESNAERSLATLIHWNGLPEPSREYVFAKPRRWRFDFAWWREKVAVEVEGGSWIAGRHTRGATFEKDCEKYAEAGIAGWLVLRVTPHMIEDGRAIALIRRALEVRRG